MRLLYLFNNECIGIATAISENLEPWHQYEYTTPESIYNHPSGLVVDVTSTLTEAYYATIRPYNKTTELNKNSKVKVAYTGILLQDMKLILPPFLLV